MSQAAERWLKLTFTLPGELLEQCEPGLWSHGALSVAVLDQHDVPLYEPPPGATPYWPVCRVEALFPDDTDYTVLVELIATELSAARDLRLTGLAERDWLQQWRDSVSELRFADRLQILPDDSHAPAAGMVAMTLAPGLAFGSGAHPTTRLCLEWLCAQALAQRTLLDYGCGSGVLAIAALRLGLEQAHAVDIDPQALQATYENALRNGVEARLRIMAPPYAPATPVDYVVANILAGPLVQLAGSLAACQRSGAAIALSGILSEQADDVMHAYRPWYDLAPAEHYDNWCLVCGQRR